jgi:hypothetical protein
MSAEEVKSALDALRSAQKEKAFTAKLATAEGAVHEYIFDGLIPELESRLGEVVTMVTLTVKPDENKKLALTRFNFNSRRYTEAERETAFADSLEWTEEDGEPGQYHVEKNGFRAVASESHFSVHKGEELQAGDTAESLEDAQMRAAVSLYAMR